MKKPDNLSGHCAIVTGASGGIGRRFCMELASRGCDIVLTDIDEERLISARQEIAGKFPNVRTFILATDLTETGIAQRLNSFCTIHAIDPDILVNNAGIFSFAPAIDIPDSKIECFVNLHMMAVTMISRWFLARRKQKRSGWLLNMSSMSCWMPMPGLSMYASTKAYIRVFTRALHYEMKDYGVGVTVACPGGIATDLFGLPDNLKRLAVRIKVLDTPERFARKAVDRMLSRKKQYINGFVNRLAIFAVGVTPTSIRMMVKHYLLDKGINRP